MRISYSFCAWSWPLCVQLLLAVASWLQPNDPHELCSCCFAGSLSLHCWYHACNLQNCLS